MGVATVPAATSISAALPSPQQTQAQPKQFAAVEDEDLDWLGLAVAKELPLKQAVCKKAEPLRQIAIKDPSATVAEYKKFLRMMVDEKGAWVSTVPRPPLFLTTKHSLSVSRGEKISHTYFARSRPSAPGLRPRRVESLHVLPARQRSARFLTGPSCRTHQFTPSKLVDELWHRHMLDSVAYCEFCERVSGGYLHHTPHYGQPHSFHDPGFTATLKACEFPHSIRAAATHRVCEYM
jgi:hypothetical protein